VSESKLNGKSFVISKRLVWEAWLRVKANKGAAGVDEQSIQAFEANLAGNLYKLWNRVCSGSYMPPPVRKVQIPKKDGRGVRTLGVPTVADRVAQTVAYLALEPVVERVFHPDSYGYRPRRSAHDALRVCRQRCWRYDWGKRRDKTVMRERMRTPYFEGLATREGPESCVGVPRGRSEALTEGDVGWVIEPRNNLFGCRRRPSGRKATPLAALARAAGGSRAVRDPRHARSLHAREPGDPMVARLLVVAGRAARGRPRP
jgi:hypothetical protein